MSAKSRQEATAFDFAVIGGGVVGAATAYKLTLRYPEARVALIEKEKTLAAHQTGRNSGVIHSGIYYQPGSLKAKNCKNGRTQLVEFAEKHKIPHALCGKLIVATTEDEKNGLEKIYSNGLANQTPGIRRLTPKEISEKEPYVKALDAIWVPSAGIIDFKAMTEKLVECAIDGAEDNKVFLDEGLQDFEQGEEEVKLRLKRMNIRAKRVIFCAGLQADRFVQKDGLEPKVRIVGFRGDYYQLKDSAKHLVNHLIYPVPDPRYPFLGVHYTPMTDGRIECGPNAVFTFKREGYNKTSFNLKDTLDALSFVGTWRLFAKNHQKGIEEYRRAFSKMRFVEELRRMIPSIGPDDVWATRAGVRAQAVDHKGNMVEDFLILKKGRNLHVVNAPSPAATACLAIADEILNQL